MSYRTFRFGSNLVLILALMAVAFTPVAALEINAASKNVTLTIGDSLFVTRDGLLPDRTYRAIVTDDAEFVIADVRITLEPAGAQEPVLVWPTTGVVGCDLDADPDPEEYRFTRMEEAEDALKSRKFNLTLLDDATQISVARIPFELLAKDNNLFFFSNEDGCPRCQFGAEEPVFLSGLRVVLDSVWMFFVESEGQLPKVGDPLEDALGGPREIQASSSYFTEQVAEGQEFESIYAGVVEPAGEEESEPSEIRTPTGVMVAPAWWDRCFQGWVGVMQDENYQPACGPHPQ